MTRHFKRLINPTMPMKWFELTPLRLAVHHQTIILLYNCWYSDNGKTLLYSNYVYERFVLFSLSIWKHMSYSVKMYSFVCFQFYDKCVLLVCLFFHSVFKESNKTMCHWMMVYEWSMVFVSPTKHKHKKETGAINRLSPLSYFYSILTLKQ